MLAAVGRNPGSCLDVGCGDGVLTRELAASASHVTGIDIDAPTIARARADTPDTPDMRVGYVCGDVGAPPFEPGSFDAVVSVAALHHIGTEPGLTRMAELLRPGGTLAVVGLARSRATGDLALDGCGVIVSRAYRLRRTYWEHTAPTCWPPPETYAQVRTIAARVLPGVQYRRHVMWRYSLVWTKPAIMRREDDDGAA